MSWIIELLVNAVVLLLMAYLLPTVTMKSFGTAIGVALVVSILNATVGLLLRLPMNVITLGLISFLVRLVVTAIMIKIADKLFIGFEVKGFVPALIIAFAMSIAGTLMSSM